MKINKKGNELSATSKTNTIMLMASIGLLFFGLGVYFFGSKVIGGVITFVSTSLAMGVLSQSFTKIIMHPDRLEVKTLFESKIFQKESMHKATWEGGVGVSIQLKDNTWVKIPDLGNSQSVCNSVRAWLKRA